MSESPPTTRQTTGAARVLAAAREHGWEVRTTTQTATMSKGGRRVFIEWSVRGAVTYGNTEKRRFIGSGKAEQALAELER